MSKLMEKIGKRLVFFLAGMITAVLMFGCATVPLHTRLSPYPNQGQSLQQQEMDNFSCSQFAEQQAAQMPGTASGAAGGSVGGAVAGAALGAIGGAFFGGAGTGAAAGAALGGVLGLLEGVGQNAQAQDQTKVLAYRNCMIAHGYVLP